MKKLNLLLTLVLAITLFSCGSDDDSQEEIVTSNLIGEWGLLSRRSGDTLYNDTCDQTSSIEFKSDGTYEEETFVTLNGACANDGDFSGPWSTSENMLTINYDGEDTTGIFSIANNVLTITYDDEGTVVEYIYEKK